VSRDVRFIEGTPYFTAGKQGEVLSNFFPLPSIEKTNHLLSTVPSIDCVLPNPDQHTQSSTGFTSNNDGLGQHQLPAATNPASNPSNDILQIDQQIHPQSAIDSSNSTIDHISNSELPGALDALPVTRRVSIRTRQPPSRMQDYVTYNVRYPISKFMSYHRLSPTHSAFLTSISNVHEPKNFKEAQSQPVLQQAMHKELKALTENHTWSIVSLPAGKEVVGCRWIFKTKFKSDGTVDRHKARLVAQGFTQKFGVDYKETFAHVAKMTTVRVLLSVAINQGWPLFQMDVSNAFLHGDLEEEVFMKLPPGHPHSGNSMLVCKLHKSIYGLKQSSRAWHTKLSIALESLGFTRSSTDSSLFIKIVSDHTLVVLIYVDDLIITGSTEASIAQLKRSLQQQFLIKDLGSLKYFLGIEMAASRKGFFLNQRKYIIDLL
jgi:hypothetical protein